MHTPVNLFFSYTQVGGVGEASMVNRTALATYNGTDSITHIEFNSQIPFQRFRVGVALMNRFIRGPINQTDREIGELAKLLGTFIGFNHSQEKGVGQGEIEGPEGGACTNDSRFLGQKPCFPTVFLVLTS